MKVLSFILVTAFLVGESEAQNCSSINAASYSKDWKPEASAPRDGTVVELLQTYGVAPTYGLYHWDQSMRHWMSATDPSRGMSGLDCLFWRPFRGDVKKYVDPTQGAQNSTAYWCQHMQARYDAKRDRCVR